MFDSDGCCCAMGAFVTDEQKAEATAVWQNNGESDGPVPDFMDTVHSDALLAMNLLARAAWPDIDYPCLATWNDEDSRTKEQVLELFDKAIATLEDANA